MSSIMISRGGNTLMCRNRISHFAWRTIRTGYNGRGARGEQYISQPLRRIFARSVLDTWATTKRYVRLLPGCVSQFIVCSPTAKGERPTGQKRLQILSTEESANRSYIRWLNHASRIQEVKSSCVASRLSSTEILLSTECYRHAILRTKSKLRRHQTRYKHSYS